MGSGVMTQNLFKGSPAGSSRICMTKRNQVQSERKICSDNGYGHTGC
uniref:Uncharacterized protein n=1 Tax=Utricularia reniformis TaxID=192314 RepID=A0A1Y0B3U5_9LAMI|nr:hypothetical protein AEK19_MT1926 [Utricularia reniformis]ART32092.1 hypothetical protein AEK19_MT1926 [Utricularia reniformis]